MVCLRFPLLVALVAAAVPAVAQQAALPGATRRPAADSEPAEVAKRAPVNGVLVLYGNERCPTDSSGNEVVICERRSAQERYRMPKELREFVVTPENAAWAAKAQATTDEGVGANGTGSCTVVGQSGQSGCAAQNFDAYRAARNARRTAAANAPGGQ